MRALYIVALSNVLRRVLGLPSFLLPDWIHLRATIGIRCWSILTHNLAISYLFFFNLYVDVSAVGFLKQVNVWDLYRPENFSMKSVVEAFSFYQFTLSCSPSTRTDFELLLKSLMIVLREYRFDIQIRCDRKSSPYLPYSSCDVLLGIIVCAD